jgi:hypothetical protein
MSSDPMSTDDRRERVEDACAALLAAGQPVAFDEVATRAGIGRATLYRNPDLRAIVEEHRLLGPEATPAGLSTEIAHLRIASTPSPPPSAPRRTIRRLRHDETATAEFPPPQPHRSDPD